ncbi:hypothetical protein ACFSKL_14410 [Belliella marina]|uniref:Uncharacterized protein n=1 Tax=Belliella marina TaxID=1644146 RepID=A0ABW4VMS5_9BACT
MDKQVQIIDEKKFFRLPFEKGTFCLKEDTLNANSKFRNPYDYYRIEISKVRFRNEILTLSIKLPDEPKKLVYLKVTKEVLLVSCNFDTDQTYLSRYAYFALWSQMLYSGTANFEEYYWPDFFDPNTGRSKYLQIINDRRGFDVYLKSKYPSFYKPGDTMLELQRDLELPKVETNQRDFPKDLSITDKVIGFTLADTILSSYHSNHYPFLVAFHGILSKDRERIKNFTSFILNENDTEGLTLSQSQEELLVICLKMRKLAPVSNADWQNKFLPNDEEIEKGKLLFLLWHHAYKLILSQKHTYFFHTRGLKYVKGKPSRSWLTQCEFMQEIPQLAIKKIDKGEYYQIELLFRINGKLNIPQYPSLAFFIRSKTNWLKKYLLGSYNDYLIVTFFARTHYKMAVLKCHYEGDFGDFMNRLSEQYEIIDS